MIADDTLYVVNTEGLCAASMGGKDSLTDGDMIIAAKGGNNPAVTSDRLYYLRKGGVSSSYLSKPLTDFETDAKVVLQNQHISQCMMGYGYVYYVDDTNYTDYYRACLTDGKIEKLLTLDGSSVIHVNLYKEHLYYMQDEYIWRCDLNGDNAEKVQEKPWREALTEEEKQSFLWYLYVANDTIYIFNSDLGRVVYEIKL